MSEILTWLVRLERVFVSTFVAEKFPILTVEIMAVEMLAKMLLLIEALAVIAYVWPAKRLFVLILTVLMAGETKFMASIRFCETMLLVEVARGV